MTDTIVREVLAACEVLHARGARRGCFPALDIDRACAQAAIVSLRRLGVRALFECGSHTLWFEAA